MQSTSPTHYVELDSAGECRDKLSLAEKTKVGV